MKSMRFLFVISLLVTPIAQSMKTQGAHLPVASLSIQKHIHFTAQDIISHYKLLKHIHAKLNQSLAANNIQQFKEILCTAFKNKLDHLHEYITQHEKYTARPHKDYYGSIEDAPLLCNAAANASVEAVEILLEAGANPDIVDEYNKKPIYYALEAGNFDSARILAQSMPNLLTPIYKKQTMLTHLCDTHAYEDINENVVHDIISAADDLLATMLTKHDPDTVKHEINKALQKARNIEIRRYLENYARSISKESFPAMQDVKTYKKKIITIVPRHGKSFQIIKKVLDTKASLLNIPAIQLALPKAALTIKKMTKKERREHALKKQAEEEAERNRILEEQDAKRNLEKALISQIEENTHNVSDAAQSQPMPNESKISAESNCHIWLQSEQSPHYTNSIKQRVKRNVSTCTRRKYAHCAQKKHAHTPQYSTLDINPCEQLSVITPEKHNSLQSTCLKKSNAVLEKEKEDAELARIRALIAQKINNEDRLVKLGDSFLEYLKSQWREHQKTCSYVPRFPNAPQKSFVK